ncbi:hypothetical protein ACJX0J_039904, partial [Zea mays]
MVVHTTAVFLEGTTEGRFSGNTGFYRLLKRRFCDLLIVFTFFWVYLKNTIAIEYNMRL